MRAFWVILRKDGTSFQSYGLFCDVMEQYLTECGTSSNIIAIVSHN